jgi:hypothetical protein
MRAVEDLVFTSTWAARAPCTAQLTVRVTLALPSDDQEIQGGVWVRADRLTT